MNSRKITNIFDVHKVIAKYRTATKKQYCLLLGKYTPSVDFYLQLKRHKQLPILMFGAIK